MRCDSAIRRIQWSDLMLMGAILAPNRGRQRPSERTGATDPRACPAPAPTPWGAASLSRTGTAVHHSGRIGPGPSQQPRGGEPMEQKTVNLTVNGKQTTLAIDPRTLLLQVLREKLGLTGTHQGCDTAQCGAFTVHVDGRAIKSCSILALQVDGRSVTTIEGLAQGDELHPVQEAFRECHGLQCGFCTPGMV